MKPMVFVPLTSDELRALRDGSLTAQEAYAATEGVRHAHGLGPGEDEEADHVAQVLASLACVRAGDPRLVAAAEVTTLPATTDDPLGAVEPPRLAWRDVRALFVDDRDHPAPADAAALDDLAGYPLLWFAPSEADHVLDQLTADRTEGA